MPSLRMIRLQSSGFVDMDIKYIRCDRILFFDIETVSACPRFESLCETGKKLWRKKAALAAPDGNADQLYPQAGLSAEFGKIVCISAGYVKGQDESCELRVRSFASHDEKTLLAEFSDLLSGYFNARDQYLCAHNGRGFDFPFLSRRMLIHQLDIPDILDVTGKKPWDQRLIDTMELWKFGDWKSRVSLETLAWLFGIPTPKDDIDGSQVGRVYWEEKDLERIAAYCNKDVITLAQIFLKLRKQRPIPEDHIVICRRSL